MRANQNCVETYRCSVFFSNLVPVYLQTEDMGMLPPCAGCYLTLHLFVGRVGAVGACGGPAPTDVPAGAKLVPSMCARLRWERVPSECFSVWGGCRNSHQSRPETPQP